MAAHPLSGPATRATAVTPHASNANIYRSLYIGVSGDVAVVLADDTVAVTFVAVPVGILPVATSLVLAIGTSATNIVGLK